MDPRSSAGSSHASSGILKSIFTAETRQMSFNLDVWGVESRILGGGRCDVVLERFSPGARAKGGKGLLL
eukprot:1375983-Amorphochlora_amoeboformis.AAC.1